jgi:sec-independent protein translocase protein TatC
MMDKPQPIVAHLQELRQRIIYALIAVVLCIAVAVVYAHRFLTAILATAASGGKLILVQNTLADTFLTEFRLALIGGLVLAFPFVLYQIIAFVLPALKPGERRLLFIGLPFATVMFVAGWLFGWFVVVPVTKSFFLDISSSAGIQNQITPSAYLSFVLSICNPLGVVFELPLVVLILARIGLVTARFLRRVRKFAFLALLILAAVLSPPDVISMTIFMVPLYGLYELSIILAAIAGPKS